VEPQVEELVREVGSSAKYRFVNPALVARIGAAELAKGRKFKEAVKATKNKLHQVGGAYLSDPPHYQGWLERLTEVRSDPQTLKTVCREMMALHASTRERLTILDEFYETLIAELPPVGSVLDVACGLNPLAIPWMGLGPGANYYACDVYSDLVDFVGAFMGLMPVSGSAAVCDVVGEAPEHEVDLALVLKTIPCLEQIDKQAGERLLDGLRAKYLMVSFPARSLGGRSKGMVENYEDRFNQLAAGRGWHIRRYEFETELVFLAET
jgi:16S rRNA (guanine(1405)-N(7))-methyltransferase